MKATDLIKLIKSKLDIDWEAKSDRGAIWLEKKERNGDIKVITWSVGHKVDGLSIDSYVSGFIGFNQMENILLKYYKKYNLNYLPYSIHVTSGRDEWLGNQKIITSDDVDAIMPIIKDMIENDIIPFFENYSSIENAYKKIEKTEKSNITLFLLHPPTIRILIMKKLVNATDFDEYADWLMSLRPIMLETANGIVYQFLPELIEELKNLPTTSSNKIQK
ncbi:hypothetical protein [Haliscomenobacter sp.]|uniref:hypothetical protein n=1 Tax=Haliscomenobacter sp. TaxID=2717303 RepID=UPI003594370B